MTDHAARLLPAMLTMIAAATLSAGAAFAADECLAKPKGLAPAGQHWYYNTDRKLQRKCWYLDDAGGKVVATARKQPVVAAPALPSPVQDEVSASPAVDARAELVETPPARPSFASVAPSDSAQVQALQEGAEGTTPRNWTVATRWPEASDLLASAPAAIVAHAPAASRGEGDPALMPAPERTVVAAGTSFDPGLLAAGTVFLVVVGGGLIVLRGRRRDASTEDMMESAIDRGGRPWMHRTAGEGAAVGSRAVRDDERDAIEHLLALQRQSPA